MYPYGIQDKKALNMLILEVLEEYTDHEHRLTQMEIVDLLKQNYGIECKRQTVKNNLLLLKEMGYEISMRGGIYLTSRKFEEAELRMLIDSVLYSHTLSSTQARRLIEKLESLGNKYFHPKVKHVSNLPEFIHSDNKQTMLNLDVLNDAIEQEKKISFIYNIYRTDFKLYPKREEPYVVSPYQMVANQGRYYLLGNNDKYDNVSHFRLDRMTNVKILDDKVKPKKDVAEFVNGYNLPRHLAEHIYMFGGKSVQVKMWTYNWMMGQLIDWFGKEFRIEKEEGDEILVAVQCDETSMKWWALQYGESVEVIEPESLRSAIKKAVTHMSATYT